MTRLTCSLTVVLSMVFAVLAFQGASAQDSATAPATMPTTTPTTTQATLRISPEAAPVLEKMKSAYLNLKSLELVGRISGEFDVDGQKENQKLDFTSSYAAPNQFKHDLDGNSLVGSTGEKVYALVRSRNIFMSAEAPKGKVMLSELPEEIGMLVGGQNLSLVLAISSDPIAEITRVFPHIDKTADEKIDDKSYITLKFTDPQNKSMVTMLIDPQTHLVRRLISDLSAELLERKAGEVKKALVTLDYTTMTLDAPVKADQFAFAPPPGAKDMRDIASTDESPAAALVGKPAPDFKLLGMDGKEVALASLKGNVVVLDFWATWCGPCITSMPDMQKLQEHYKDAKFKLFAINLAEGKEKIEGFLASHKLTLAVLLDTDAAVGNAYKADAIPTTIVIGKDGVVSAAFTGVVPTGPNSTHNQIRAAVDKALKMP